MNRESCSFLPTRSQSMATTSSDGIRVSSSSLGTSMDRWSVTESTSRIAR